MNNFNLSLIALFACAAGVSTLSCESCRKVTCRMPKCKAGVTVIKGICGCCRVCSKQLYEDCGGLWGTKGRCDPQKGFVCVKGPICNPDGSPPADTFGNEHKTGVCMKKSDVINIRMMCQT